MIRTVKNLYHLMEAIMANLRYGFPSKHMIVVGVTGTDGKTTTSSLIYHMLKTSGKKAALISTNGAYIGDEIYDVGFHVTTPSAFLLQKYIKKATDQGVTHLVLEVTSHGLDQNRAWGVKFHTGVLTNITHEHWDYHKSYQKYLEAKLKLLQASDTAIINMDDQSYGPVKSRLNGKKIITYSLRAKAADLTPGKFAFQTSLIGDFNRQNCLAAIAAVKNLGIPDGKVRLALKTFSPPEGRQDSIYKKDFTVMIDFAHTPNAFMKVLPEVKKMTKGRLIHLFGAAAKRDESKRPEMGEASGKFADIIILTAEDPRGDSVESINSQIRMGMHHVEVAETLNDLPVEGKKICYSIPDREQAIQFAVNIAKKGDLVLLTGKSHEKSMNYGKGEVEWNEKKIALQAINQRKLNH